MDKEKVNWKIKIWEFFRPNKLKVTTYIIILLLIFLENFGPIFGVNLLSETRVLGGEKDIMVIEVPKYHLGYIFEITSNIIAYYNITTHENLPNLIIYLLMAVAITISFLFYYTLSCFLDLLIKKIFKIRKKGMLYLFFTSLFLYTSTRKISRIRNNEESKYVRVSGIILLLVFLTGCNDITIICDRGFLTQPSFRFEDIIDYSNLQIKLDFSNKGDVYSLIIFGNNTYHYMRDSPSQEEFEGNLKNETIANLLKEFEHNKFNYMKRQYYCSRFTDAGVSEITLIFNEKIISVSAYASDGPDEFYNIRRLMLKILNYRETNNE